MSRGLVGEKRESKVEKNDVETRGVVTLLLSEKKKE